MRRGLAGCKDDGDSFTGVGKMEKRRILEWGSSVVDPVALLEHDRGFVGRDEKTYSSMGCLREDEYKRLLNVSRNISFAFAICGSLSETALGIRNRNKQQAMSKSELDKMFPRHQQKGIPHFNDVDVWYEKEGVGAGDLFSFKSKIAFALGVPFGKVDTKYADHHATLSDLSFVTRAQDRRRAPGGIIFSKGKSWRLFAAWQRW
jgi:hypothetical protein